MTYRVTVPHDWIRWVMNPATYQSVFRGVDIPKEAYTDPMIVNIRIESPIVGTIMNSPDTAGVFLTFPDEATAVEFKLKYM